MLFLKRRGFEKEYIDKEKYIGYKSLWIREVIFWGKIELPITNMDRLLS